MVSILPAGGDSAGCIIYQHTREEQTKSPPVLMHSQYQNPSNNGYLPSSYIQQQNRNIHSSNTQGTRVSRLQHQGGNFAGEMKSIHTRSASMPEAVYLKVHHHQQQTAVVPPNHFQPVEIPPPPQQLHNQHPQSTAQSSYNQRLLPPPQLALASQNMPPPPQLVPQISQYYPQFIKVHQKPYAASSNSQHPPMYAPLHPPQPQHPAVSLRRSHTNAGDYLSRRKEAKLSTFYGKSQLSPGQRTFSPALQNLLTLVWLQKPTFFNVLM